MPSQTYVNQRTSSYVALVCAGPEGVPSQRSVDHRLGCGPSGSSADAGGRGKCTGQSSHFPDAALVMAELRSVLAMIPATQSEQGMVACGRRSPLVT